MYMNVLLTATCVAFSLSFLVRLLVEFSLTADIPLLGDFVTLEFVENRGIAFGITFPFLLQSVLVAGALLFVCFLAYQSRKDRFASISLGLILGGALANIVDRIDDGVVTDFISVGSFPTFNVGDSFITVGVAFLLLREYRRKRPSARMH